MTESGKRAAFRGAWVTAAAAVLLVAAGCRSSGPAPAPTDLLREHGLQGRVVLIEFGAVGGSLSRQGLDLMVRWHEESKVKDLAYVRVEVSKDRQAADAYYAANPPGFPVHRDADGSLALTFDATVRPTFVLVDKFGRVRYRGPLPDELKLLEWGELLVRETADPGPDARVFGVSRSAVRRLLDETRLPDLAGAVGPLQARMGRRGLAAVFVDTRCPFSGEAIADMARVARTLAEHEIGSVLVNLKEPKDTVLGFFGERDPGAPVVYDESAATQEKWQVDFVPTVMLFDAEGTLVHRGRAVWSVLAAAVEEIQSLEPGSLDFGVVGTEYG